jgi:glycosyltransferase involved in cell wall biosynthesis
LIVLVVPGSLDTPTGGYVYDRRIVEGLRTLGWQVEVRSLDGSFPSPDEAARAATASAFASIPSGLTVLVDGLAGGVIPAVMEREATRLRVVSLVHHPLADETGISPEDRSAFTASERRSVAASRRVVVTSRATAMRVSELFGVAPEHIAVVEPGVDRGPLSQGSESATPALLCVATISPRKGYGTLVRALAMIRDRPWHLTIVGSLDRHRPSVELLRESLHAAGLEGRVTLAGEADAPRISTYYQRSDLFVLATEYEGYGMVVAEALAHGLPVVSTPVGAIPDLVGNDAGMLVPVGDTRGLADAIAKVFDNADVRLRLRTGAARIRDRLDSWETASKRMADVLTHVATESDADE